MKQSAFALRALSLALGLPSPSALPDELFLFTGAAATGNAWIDEIKVTIL